MPPARVSGLFVVRNTKTMIALRSFLTAALTATRDYNACNSREIPATVRKKLRFRGRTME